MNNRELFRAALSFEPTGRLCHMEHGIWPEVYERWTMEGLPQNIGLFPNPDLSLSINNYIANDVDIYKYFNVIKEHTIPINQYYYPAFLSEILEETENYITIRTSNGVLQKTNKKNRTIPQLSDYPITCRKDYHRLKERLTGNIQERYPDNWEKISAYLRSQTQNIVRIRVDGFFGYPRELMGVTDFIIAFCA